MEHYFNKDLKIRFTKFSRKLDNLQSIFFDHLFHLFIYFITLTQFEQEP